MKLSIIIPAYNAEPYLKELIDCLDKQMNDSTEVIIVDDGSKTKVDYSRKWLRIIRQKNKGAGAARNKGIDNARGKYITFVDADDLVADDYVQQISAKIDEIDFDICEMSWKSLTKEGAQFDYRLSEQKPRLRNCSSCMRVFKKSYIGDVRFSELKDATQDEDFSRRLGYLHDESLTRTFISDYMYLYRTAVCDSQVKKFKAGLRKTKRIVYYYNHVTPDMTWLVDEIRKDDELNEVWLLTNKCEIPELARWCQIHTPFHLWTHYVKGESYHNVELIKPPYQTQVVLYINHVNIVGGIQSFIYHFAKIMGQYYDITYIINDAKKEHIEYMRQVVKVLVNPKEKIYCDTLIMLRILDSIPGNIEYKKSIQMCHACKTKESLHIPRSSDYIVNVSQSSKDSFKEEAQESIVIHNLISHDEQKPLVLMSATRIPARDKGNNEERMRILADMLNDAQIPFIWLNFSDGIIPNPPKNFFNMGLHMNASGYFKMASYVVLLSDSEAWSYTLLEALTQNIPVLTCPFPSALEMGVEDGKNGYIVPFDMDFDVNKLLTIPKFDYEYDNDKIVDQWKKLLNAKPKPKPERVKVRCTVFSYHDLELGRKVYRGDEWTTSYKRAKFLEDEKHLVKIV